MRTGPGATLGLGAAAAFAALAYDPRAEAADPKRALGLLLAVALLAAAIARRQSRAGRAGAMRAAPGALCFLAFSAWSGLTLTWGVPAGARDLGTWVAAAGLAVVVLRWPASSAREAASFAALLTGTGAAAVAVVEYARGARGLFVHGGQGNANWLGLLLAVTMPLTVGLLSARPGTRSRRAAMAAAGALLLQAAGLVLSHSRVAWAAAFEAARQHRLGQIGDLPGYAMLTFTHDAFKSRSLGDQRT